MRPLAAALTVLALVLPSARAVVTSDYVFGWKNLMYKDMWCEELSLTRVTATSGDWSAILERLGGCNSWLDEDPSSHTLFIPAGRYRFSRDTTICKPIQAQDGVVFVVDRGVKLTLRAPLSHPPISFFEGDGNVVMTFVDTAGLGINPVAPVEWFGAKGDGVTDDSAAIARAIRIAGSILFGAGKTYGIGSTIYKPAAVHTYAGQGSVLKALKAGLTGVILANDGMGTTIQLPTLTGFARAIQATGFHIVSVPAINNCKDAIFLWIQNQGDLAGIRANIGTITNCKRAVVYAGAPAGANIMQGNSIVVGSFIDKRGGAKALVHFMGPNRQDWDSNYYEFGVVRALAANNFALMRCDEGTACNGNTGVPRQTLVIKTLQPLAPSARLVQGIFFPDNELRIGIVQPFTQGQLDMPAGGGQSLFMNNYIFTEPPALAARVYTLTPTPALATFNGGVPAHSTLMNVAVPAWGGVWPKGETRIFYFFHMLAQNKQQYYVAEPNFGGACQPNGVAVVTLVDKSFWEGQPQYLVAAQLVACWDIGPGTPVQFQVMIGTVGL